MDQQTGRGKTGQYMEGGAEEGGNDHDRQEIQQNTNPSMGCQNKTGSNTEATQRLQEKKERVKLKRKPPKNTKQTQVLALWQSAWLCL